MSREIKNTLFRFATLRAPELGDTPEDKFRFIKHPDTKESFFFETKTRTNNDPNKSIREILQEKSINFQSDSLKSKDEIQVTVGTEFFNFAKWLISNRTDISIPEVELKRIEQLIPLTEEQKLAIWDNIFYQIITYKSGTVRELLFSILVTDFFIYNYKNIEQTDEAYKKLAQARIVVPKSFLRSETALNDAKAFSTLQTKILDKELNTIVLNDTLHYYSAIKNSIEKAQKSYEKNKQERYDSEYLKYQDEVKELYENAKTEEQEYKDPITNIKHTRAKYVDLNIPDFNFEKLPELNKRTLSKTVPVQVQEFVETLSNTEGFSTFNEITDYLEQEINTTTEVLFEESTLENTVVNYNGNIIQVANDLPTGAIFSIGGSQLTPATLLFNTDFQNAYIVSANYQVTFPATGEIISATSFVDTIINNKLSVKIVTDNEVSFANKAAFYVSGEFVLNNDTKVVFTGRGRVAPKQVNLGFIPLTTGYDIVGSGQYTTETLVIGGPGGPGGGNPNPEDPVTYIPSGQGVKRLGIADYRRVEQTVCCYVPGEVSHIENIMAREFKEKETRRLRRKEDTTTTSTEQETEKLTDTTTADRFEMNQETASVIAKDKQIGAHAEFSYNTEFYNLNTGADFSTATSTEDSNSQAVTYAKDVTERALDRVVQKTKEERVIKITEEFEEKNVHGYDNRQGDSHISGVYRWVDKIYKNQVVNYGKRLMYEFMIPEPAAFHNAAILGEDGDNLETMIMPVDPRTVSGILNLKDYTKITEATYAHWAGLYNAEVSAKPKATIGISKGFNGNYNSTGYYTTGNDVIQIPEGYEVFSAKASLAFDFHPFGMEGSGVSVNVGDKYYNYQWHKHFNKQNIEFNELGGIQNELAVAYKAFDCGTFSMTVVANCSLTTEAYKQWQIDTFNIIIKAYENKLADYNSKLTEVADYKVNPGFFRQIENMVLRKNCISYLASHANVGTDLLLNRDSVENFKVDYNNANLETYAARVKFFEQAFEWNLMSYNFYPFYWANKSKWKSLYNVTEFNDPLHRSFLQSGMARVIVTVRPGFEEAVNWYISTGQIWNGGQVPTVDDALFLSIVEELQEPEGAVEDTWETRVPTALTVIQAGAIGLNVEGLPCNVECDDFKLFDSDGEEILDADGNSFTNPIEQTEAKLGITNTRPGTPPIDQDTTPVDTGGNSGPGRAG